LNSLLGAGLAAVPVNRRNSAGDKVDVLIERGEHLVPVEIKSSQTFNADDLAGLSKWSKYAGA